MAEGELQELKYFDSNTTLVILDLSTDLLKKIKISPTQSSLLTQAIT
jgi:hypothetical protein